MGRRSFVSVSAAANVYGPSGRPPGTSPSKTTMAPDAKSVGRCDVAAQGTRSVVKPSGVMQKTVPSGRMKPA